MSISKRLDVYLVDKFSISRNIAKQKIGQSLVKVNDKIITKSNFQVKENDIVELNNINVEIKNINMKPWNKKIDIIYEDDYIFVVNKPNDIIVHPSNYEVDKTLANIALNLFNDKGIEVFGDPLRMGIVHRLDKCTEGLLIIAKNQESFDKFTKLFLDKDIEKTYQALTDGHLKTKVVEVHAPIKRVDNSNKREVSTDYDSKNAISIFKEIEKYKDFSLVEIKILTGRTHQIRVHAEYIKNNILNDPIYGPKHNNKRTKYGQYLFANNLKFFHPFLKKEINISLEIPKEFKEYIKKYGK